MIVPVFDISLSPYPALSPNIATPLAPTLMFPAFTIFPLLPYIATDLSPANSILAPELFVNVTQPLVVSSCCAIATKPDWVPLIFLLLVIVELERAILLYAAADPVLVVSTSESTLTFILLLSNKKAL